MIPSVYVGLRESGGKASSSGVRAGRGLKGKTTGTPVAKLPVAALGVASCALDVEFCWSSVHESTYCRSPLVYGQLAEGRAFACRGRVGRRRRNGCWGAIANHPEHGSVGKGECVRESALELGEIELQPLRRWPG